MRFLAALLLAVAMAGAVPGESDAAPSQLTVFAAASLAEVLPKVASVYEQQSGVKIIFNFAGSNDLSRQIQQGAPADVFFSANLDQIALLEGKNLWDKSSRKTLLSNQLVIVVPSDRDLRIQSPADLLSERIRRIALADPAAVPAGIYAKQYLEKLGYWQRLRDRMVPTLDVRAALAAVASGNVDTGFVYRTDAAISRQVKIAYAVPLEAGPRIVYPAAAVKQARNFGEALQFLKFLQNPRAAEIFHSYGFVTLK